ncbi:endonuclease/exonuclease/phosphatase [Micromonospora sp. ATCC 39149]|uniref:Endonuclease/exonuclease/phosphatase family protein n=1 Tax=Micromonospora carbonacea TaxID=47853 RepID=A0A7D5Y597_9ACTN|nr:endonuclease/exonuclease/phosphatase family protein [Micromonospora sp. ATCC 39149]EEP70550.1 endonuclease/exonuclease/phosphatase [Micromonospora sp. ATCC 39149]QLJ96932.1 endonuclease/exonuclease/phosphatase family protein [Micromonospora carbonacea]
MTTGLSVATYNLYQGAGTIPAYAAPSLPAMAVELRRAFATMEASGFPERAAAIAGELAAHRPELVGIQEVAYWRCGDRVYDFLEILRTELAAAGAPYRTAATAITTPLAAHTDGDVAGVTDRVALLVRADLPAGAAGEQIYRTRIEMPVPSGLVAIKTRGFAWADVRVGDRPVRVVSTHFEAFDPDIRLAQVGELIDVLDAAGVPAIVLGDFNAVPDDEPYRLLRKHGFRDAWTEANGDADGFTGVRADIAGPSDVWQRLDYVMHRGTELTAGAVTLLGAGRLPSGRWPSDHAGLVAAFA